MTDMIEATREVARKYFKREKILSRLKLRVKNKQTLPETANAIRQFITPKQLEKQPWYFACDPMPAGPVRSHNPHTGERRGGNGFI